MTDLGLRFAVLLVLFMLGVFLMVLLAGPLGTWISGGPDRVAWLVFGLLATLDLGALVLGVVVHRKVLEEAAGK